MIYLDTSVVVPLFVREPASEAVSDWFSANTDALVAADWLVTEFASALSIKVRKGHVKPATAQQVWEEFEVLCAGGASPAARRSRCLCRSRAPGPASG